MVKLEFPKFWGPWHLGIVLQENLGQSLVSHKGGTAQGG